MATTGLDLSKKIDPKQLPEPTKVCVFHTLWNERIVSELKSGVEKIAGHFDCIQLDTYEVPGAMELGYAVAEHARNKQANAYIVLGCVIRGETPHFDYVCASVTRAVTLLNIRLTVPVIFGVLTVNSVEEAMERLGGNHGHKGEEAMWTALQMVQFKNRL